MRNLLSLKLLVVSFGLILLLAGTVQADTKKISGTTNVEDTRIYSLSADEGQGGAAYLWTDGDLVLGFLVRVKNVASELGVGATDITAVCSLYCYDQYGGEEAVSAYQVFKPWVEGILVGSNCTGSGNGATWNDWNCLDLEWGTAGCGSADDGGSDNSGDGTGADRKATAEDSQGIDEEGVWFSWSISAELAQAWYDETADENGLYFLNAGTNQKRFYSTEYSVDPSLCPFFVFTYTTDGEEPAGNPRRKKLLSGAEDEEDYHNPRLACPIWDR